MNYASSPTPYIEAEPVWLYLKIESFFDCLFVFEDTIFTEVIKVKWGHKDGVLIQ
jgi:hypothetical protein